MPRLLKVAVKAVVFPGLLLMIPLGTAMAQQGWNCPEPVPGDFKKTVLTNIPGELMKMSIAENGYVYIATRDGILSLYRPGQGLSEVGEVKEVSNTGENGLLGVILDPAFSTNRWIYLFYSKLVNGEYRHLVERYVVTAGEKLDMTTVKEVISWGRTADDADHAAGALAWDRDGNLFIATGDNTDANSNGGYAPISEDNRFDCRKAASNTNDLRGKILRIHPEANGTYTIPAGNLFPPGMAKTRPEIYTMGHRNPFGIGYDKVTGWLFAGEVGPDARRSDPAKGPIGHDEINLIKGPGNFGFPFLIADNQPYIAPDGKPYDPNNLVNSGPWNTGMEKLPPAQPAWIWYNNDASQIWKEMGPPMGNCGMAGPVYNYDHTSTNKIRLPAAFNRRVFIYDWSREDVKSVEFDGQGKVVKIRPFLDKNTIAGLTHLDVGTDGTMYLLENRSSKLSKIEYTGSCLPSTPSSTVIDFRQAARSGLLALNPMARGFRLEAGMRGAHLRGADGRILWSYRRADVSGQTWVRIPEGTAVGPAWAEYLK